LLPSLALRPSSSTSKNPANKMLQASCCPTVFQWPVARRNRLNIGVMPQIFQLHTCSSFPQALVLNNLNHATRYRLNDLSLTSILTQLCIGWQRHSTIPSFAIGVPFEALTK
jgi:hypothetical protein